MSIVSLRSVAKALAALSLLLVLAACQTTGLKPGNVQSGYAPAGWKVQSKGAKTFYLCPRTLCKKPQLVVTGPLKVRGNAETAIRQNVLSKDIVDAVYNVLNVASKGKVVVSPVRRIVTPTYSGFESHIRLKTKVGTIHIASRDILQKDRGMTVVSAATSKSIASRNLRRYLQKTKIVR